MFGGSEIFCFYISWSISAGAVRAERQRSEKLCFCVVAVAVHVQRLVHPGYEMTNNEHCGRGKTDAFYNDFMKMAMKMQFQLLKKQKLICLAYLDLGGQSDPQTVPGAAKIF